jgi:glycogen operon protein
VLEARSDGGPLFIVLNAAPETIDFKVPEWLGCGVWKPALDTTVADGSAATGAPLKPGAMSKVPPSSVLVFEGVK